MFHSNGLSPGSSQNETSEPMAVFATQFIFKTSFFFLNVFQITMLIFIPQGGTACV